MLQRIFLYLPLASAKKDIMLVLVITATISYLLKLVLHFHQ